MEGLRALVHSARAAESESPRHTGERANSANARISRFMAANRETLMTRTCIRNKALYLVFGFIANRFDPHDFWMLACSLADQFRRSVQSLGLPVRRLQTRVQIQLFCSMMLRNQNDVRRAGLVAKPVAGSSENKDQNQRNHQIVLPGAAREIPRKSIFLRCYRAWLQARGRPSVIPFSLYHSGALVSHRGGRSRSELEL